eukprot:TRINITY_DN41509_c0_g1_i1.p1 TRINITY_DN41509_c0_g1~~TRINITY_DN41509_c0_g1_i1.p1  ORF type:complete len:658 (+),score=88.83 TRINITY_DN41509_c0_g1_i1:57-2030(+)
MASAAAVLPPPAAVGERRHDRRNVSMTAVAVYMSASPLDADSPYHAFAACPPTAGFRRPAKWPGPVGSHTVARLLWNDTALYVCWELEGDPQQPIREGEVAEDCLKKLQGDTIKREQRTILIDERVECFLWQPSKVTTGDRDDDCRAKRRRIEASREKYYAFEINYDGKALTDRAAFGGHHGFDWNSDGAYTVWTKELAVGWGGSASPVPAAVAGMSPPFKRVVIAEFNWKAMEIDIAQEIRIGLHRAEYPKPRVAGAGGVMQQADVDKILGEFVWTSWLDPDDDEVNFHRPDFFASLLLAPKGKEYECSCLAARLVKPNMLRILSSPKPSLDECPPGSLLIKGKYTSLCGSDLPYFKAKDFRAPSCYWDRDGFCGHETLGVVVASKSARFKPGDPVMALPSSYFKAHTASFQEWYREDVHGVLLTDFPVRGGFSEVYTSHELYSYKLKECVPRLLAAQALGTLLRMAKKIGPVFGRTVVVVGQGQNGLMATRLMGQLCAKRVIAVEPLEYRRKIAVKFGATDVFAPAEAQEGILALTDGKGADVVLEMVGHNQSSINECLDYVACSGIVVAFGVPDDAVYESFQFSKFYRKNVKLIASVIPDPGTDFAEAVELIEQNRFSTDGIFTHTFPLADVSRAFDVAANYKDGVVKLVVELD